MVIARDVSTLDGRSLRVHDGSDELTAPPALTLMWHHGSPQTGAILAPLLGFAAARGIRIVSSGRSGYGGSTPEPGRDVAAAASDAAAVADALGIDRFSVMGASGGGPHALACAALLPDRVTAVVTLAGIAPFDAEGLDWFAGMADTGALHAAAEGGREARAAFEETAEFDPTSFNAADRAALAGTWAALGEDVGLASAAGPDGLGGLVDDDVAFTRPWGFDVQNVRAPALIVQGDDDRVVPLAHGRWLARTIPSGDGWWCHGDGHISVLDVIPAALDWVVGQSGVRRPPDGI